VAPTIILVYVCLCAPCRDVPVWKDCVLTVDEFVTAFEARDPRCVAPDLLATVSMGPSAAEAGLADATQSLAYFFSGPDVLAKYLRMSYPEVSGEGEDPTFLPSPIVT
jgi:hypothetical protein